jgi:hypothetical protein
MITHSIYSKYKLPSPITALQCVYAKINKYIGFLTLVSGYFMSGIEEVNNLLNKFEIIDLETLLLINFFSKFSPDVNKY